MQVSSQKCVLDKKYKYTNIRDEFRVVRFTTNSQEVVGDS